MANRKCVLCRRYLGLGPCLGKGDGAEACGCGLFLGLCFAVTSLVMSLAGAFWVPLRAATPSAPDLKCVGGPLGFQATWQSPLRGRGVHKGAVSARQEGHGHSHVVNMH